jgi:hypothetical protein
MSFRWIVVVKEWRKISLSDLYRHMNISLLLLYVIRYIVFLGKEVGKEWIDTYVSGYLIDFSERHDFFKYVKKK